MAIYPAIAAGQRLTSSVLSAMVPNIVVKSASTDRVSTTTLAADPELTGIALAVGTWQIEALIFATTVTTNTQKLKTQWAFTGTWNTPIRACYGPGSTNTGTRDAITPGQFNGVPTNTDVTYGFAASTGYNVVREVCDLVVVTVAGNMSLTWAQSVSSANATSIKQGSSIRARRIA